MSFAKAVARAGSLAALLAAARRGDVFARAADFFMNGRSTRRTDRNIPSAWWADAHDINPAAGRATFVMGGPIEGASYELLAIGIEVESAAVEALWPVESKPPGLPRGPRPSAAWEKVQPHFDKLVDQEGPFPSLGSARDSVKLFLTEKNLSRLDDRTIERWINRHRPHWVRGA
jgi:hypothetical protein